MRTAHVFATQTDTEVVAHLLARERQRGKTPREAVKAVLPRLEGAFALAILFKGESNLLIGARKGSPLAVGHGDGEMFLGSDAIALAPFTNTRHLSGRRRLGRPHAQFGRDLRQSEPAREAADEFLARPRPCWWTRATTATSWPRKSRSSRKWSATRWRNTWISPNAAMRMPENLPFDFAALDRITITACGTASYAGLAAKYWFERIARLPTEVDIASEFRYREAPLAEERPGHRRLPVRRDRRYAGGTALLQGAGPAYAGHRQCAGIDHCARKRAGASAPMPGPKSALPRPRPSPASSPRLACLAMLAGKLRGTITREQEQRTGRGPDRGTAPYGRNPEGREAHCRRGARRSPRPGTCSSSAAASTIPIALEGALKLKEISYIHAEGYAAGELKHGPIALIDENVPVIVIAPHDDLYRQDRSPTWRRWRRAAARSCCSPMRRLWPRRAQAPSSTIRVPRAHPFISPLLYAVPVQLLAYHAAVFMGTDVDQPRNLAKSVTVE